MAVSYNDKFLLGGDATFQNRVKASLIAACISIKNEAVTTAFHRERETFVVSIMNNPDAYKVLFAGAAATDTSVINDATSSGTVALTTGNVATQQASVTDAHIDNAISSQFNSFFRTPAG